MAKTVQPVAIELGIKGGEKLAALNRSFRDLSKQVKLSDADITQATKDIVKFATEAGNSEATIKGQIKAFEGLREQAALGGKAYTELTQGISKLQSTLRGSSDAVERERLNLVKLGSASKNSAKDLQYVIGQLEKLKSKVRENSAAFLQLGKDIKNLNVNLKEVEISAGKARFAINTILSAKPEKITGQIKKLNAAIASGTLEAEDLNIALRKLELLKVGAGRGPVAFRADVFSSRLGVDYFARLRKEYDNLEKTQAAISQRISEVNTELQNVSGYERRRSLTLELIRLNKELQQSIVNVTTREQFQAMAIRQRMGSARESYAASGFGAFSAEIRQRTAGGEFTPGMQRARERAEGRARERRELEQIAQLQQEINRLEGEYVDSARSAVQTIQNLQLKRHEEFMSQIAAEDAAQKKAFQEQQSREEREYQRRVAIGRQMRTGEFASRRLIGMPNQELSQLYGGIVRIGQADQMRQLEMMGRGYDEVANDIRKVTAASNGSVSSLNAQRSAWSSLRDILDPASQQFKEVTREIERVDKALEKTQRRRRRMSPMQMTQAAGAAISGGIFGGPEGFLGGAIGAIGGVGGAFAGAAIGAQVGGLRRQLGEFADYAAGIQKLQIALEEASGSQAEFNRAVTAARRVVDDFNVPQDAAIQGMTKLTAAVTGAGGSVSDAELVFRNVTAAIKGTGGSAQDVEGAITAMVQVFSKGKVSAEELSGQLGERLAGAVTRFAEANNMSLVELQEELKAGRVGLNELMKFIIKLGVDFEGVASQIANSSQDAGARLQIAFNDMRIAIGKELQPIGSEFQDAFAEFIKDITPALVEILPRVGKLVLALARNIDILAGAIAGMSAAMLAVNFKAFIAGITAIKAVATGAKFAALLLNPWVALAAGIGAAVFALSRYRREAIKTANAVSLGGEAARIDALKQLSSTDQGISLAVIRKREAVESGDQREVTRLDRQLQRLRSDRSALKQALQQVEKATKDVEVNKYDTPKPDGGAADRGAKAARDAERIAQQLAQIKLQGDAIERSKALLDVNTEIRENARQIIFAQTENNTQKAYALRQDAISLEFLKKDLEIQLDYQKAVEAAALEEKAQIRAAQLQLAEKQRIFGIEENINNALNDRIGLVQENTIELKKQAEALEDARFGLREQLGMVDPKERVARAQQEFTQQYPGATAEDLDLIRQQIDPTPFEKVQQNITQLKRELKELVDPVNQITGAATAIGDAFSQAFTDVISGAKSTEQALADAFESIGKAFLEMAAEIIAKQLTMIALQTILKVLGAVAGGGGSGGDLDLAEVSNYSGVGANTRVPTPTFRADGGPVNANQPYIVGERGPELFMPSSSGMVMSNENLQAQNRAFLDSIDTENGGTVSDDSETEREATVATRAAIRESERIQENRMQIMSQQKEFDRRYERERIEQMASTPGKLDIKYESQVINGVEYVTAEQHRKGMAQAAERGRALTLQALQNSVKTRSRVGI